MITNESDCKITTTDYSKHWNTAYKNTSTEKLGWYEDKSTQILQLIEKTKVSKNAKILNVGIGSSNLIDDLLADNYTNLIANDLAEESISQLQERLGDDSKKVQFIVDDLIKPSKLNKLEDIDIWCDRAVLHFFLKENEQNAYFNLLKKVLKPNGFVIIATFATNGAEKCCGLPLQRYSVEMLQEHLGEEFVLRESFNHTFVNPFGGERPYVYALFQRQHI